MFSLVYPDQGAPLLPRPSAASPGPASSEDEILPIVEPYGLVIGRAPRSYCHGGSHILHPVVHLHVVDRDGRLFVQQRSKSKELYPGRWDTGVGGHISYGETIEEALFREAEEEIGLTGFNPVFLESYVWESLTETELVCVFATVGNFDLHPQNGEVSGGKYLPIDEIKEFFGKSIFTPNFEQELSRIAPMLLALL